MEIITPKSARKLALYAQGLLHKNKFGAGKQGALVCIRHLGYIQIDTISVVERAHHHVLWTRGNRYRPEFLHALLKDRQIFEYWSHAAAYLPMSAFRYSLPAMHAHRTSETHWFKKDQKLMNFVMDRIRSEGPLTARDFEGPEKRSGVWWDWKPAKKALEQLFMEGRLVVAERRNFQKVYDLPERVLPANLDLQVPTLPETATFLIKSTIRAHGLVAEAEIGYMRRGLRPYIKEELAHLLEAGEITKIGVNGLNDVSFYTTPDLLEILGTLRRRNNIAILSPFDNAVIQRNRVKRLFGFDFQLECYVPKPKRKYGYFCLPILWGDKFVGRMDAKADRKQSTLVIHNIFWEAGFKVTGRFGEKMAVAIRSFAAFNGCEKIRYSRAIETTIT